MCFVIKGIVIPHRNASCDREDSLVSTVILAGLNHQFSDQCHNYSLNKRVLPFKKLIV